MDCGPTCLRMVAKHYGKDIPQQYFREKTQIGKDGVNLLGISEAAETVNFRTQCVKLDYTSLVRDAKLPAILHWNQNHFVVLYKVKGRELFIADPAKGLMKYSPLEFKSHWISDKDEEGVALVLEPSPAFYATDVPEGTEEKKEHAGFRFNNIFHYLSPFRKLIFQLFVGLGVVSLLQLFFPFLTRSVVDTGINTGNIHFVYIVLLAQLALFTGRMAVEFVRSWILLHISSRINISILTDFFIKLMKLPVSFFDSKHTGDILQRMNDHNRIESFLTGSSLNTLFSLVNLVVFSVVLALFNVYIFSVFLIASVLYSIWVVLFLKKRSELDYRRFGISAMEQGITIQMVQGMQEIKLHGVEKPMRWGWERLQAKLFKLNMKNLSLNQWQQAGAFFINEGKNIFITFLSAKAVIDGQMTLGTMLAVQYIIGQLNSPVEQMIGLLQSWQNAKISMDRLNEIHTLDDEEPKSREFQYQLPASFARQLAGGRSDVMKSSIHFTNVSFTYPGAGNEPVLKDINLSIPKGKTTAIVGTSGSGKTTLLKLLLKFYEPQKGEIKLDSTSLGNISHKFWRSHCGVVMQESFIFSDTIAHNIAVGADRVDMDKLQQAVEIANIRDFVEGLPLGFNTKIGAEGTGISMGQKQRILIARSVYRNPEFILFDEATNSLDANNESMIIKNLGDFFTGRTVVLVAHRLSTVKSADQIIVLNKGVITEKGTHTELVSARGEYFTLVRSQLELGA
jgi:ATP-binding cassette, subfamily B, bacterial